MKPYTVEVDIDLPRERVIELFDNADNLYKWQPGLQSFEHLSGEPGQPGASSRMV
ncbi:MAG: SRPBCC family protein [Planctomycetota bacterium]